MFGNWHLQDRFVRKLRVIHESSPKAAEDIGETHCCRSARCCWTRPCDLGQGDPEKIAAHLGITPQELFKRDLVVDEDGAGKLCLRPRRGEQSGGVKLTSDQTFDIDTPCVFLDTKNNNACRIHDVKPQTGREYKCWEHSTNVPIPTWSEEALKELGWVGEESDYDCTDPWYDE